MVKAKKRIIIPIILIFVIILITILSIYIYGEIQSLPTEEVKEECNIETKKYSDRNVYILSPKNNTSSDKIILYCHGGAYIGELTKTHWSFLKSIAIDTGYTIIIPEYPLTPLYNYEDVFEFMEPLYKEIINKIDANKLILMGDSAGGGLSLALVQKMGEEGIQMPAKTILISPWIDVRMENPKIKEIEEKDNVINVANLKLAGIAYAGTNGMESYLVNPIDGPLDKLKNIVIFTGTYDVLNPDVHVLIKRAEKKNVQITLKETVGARHIWILNKDDENEYMAKEDYEILIQEIKN